MSFESPQGIAFSYNGKNYTVTSLSVSLSAGEFDVTSIADTPAASEFGVFRPGVMRSADLSVEWFGLECPEMDKNYTLSIGGGTNAGVFSLTNSSYTAVCTSSQVTAQAGELLKGTASFKISHD